MSWNKMRPMMVATSDDDTVLINDASQKYRRGFWSFAKNNWLSFASSLAGLTGVVGIITFTFWLSRQHFNCPSWAADCTVMPTVAWIKDHFGLVQGIVTLIYSTGLSALASSGHTMAEAAIWLLLTKQPFSLNQMDTYLSASRGSTISILSSLGFVKTWETGLVLSCAGMVAVLPLLASLDVGFVYTQQNQTVLYNSILAVGGGEGRLFQQTNPPNSLLADSANFYSSWARNLSTEPMPQYRDWYIDRQVLSERGNMTINAVKFNKNVSCSGTSLTRAPSGNFTFLTDMSGHNRTHGEESEKTVALRSYPYLSVWAANYTFPSTNRTRAELIFTALNGTIQGGTWTELQNVEHILGASAVACQVDIEFVDDMLTIGNPPVTEPIATVSSVNKISGHGGVSNSLNEVILWFAVAPLLCGQSVDGKQPTFSISPSSGLPVPYTSTAVIDNSWNLTELEQFIDVAIGAVALDTIREWFKENVSLSSWQTELKLDPSRPALLLVLPILVVACVMLLACWNAIAHSNNGLPIMRLAKLGEVLKSSQNEEIRELAAEDARVPNEPAILSQMRVKFRWTHGIAELKIFRGSGD